MSQIECSFSLKHYRHILQTAIENGYEFALFNDYATAKSEYTCLLRHDIDYTPEKSIEFGKIEVELGIRSTYFYQIVASTYNIMERNNYDIIQELSKMGHQIALHFDVTWHKNASWDNLPNLCRQEQETLRNLAGVEVPDIISLHNPGEYGNQLLDKTVCGIHHTYEKRYFSEIKYISDSQGWYEGCICKIFENRKYPKIQLLTHPYIWWQSPKSSFIEDIAHLINYKKSQLTDYIIKYHPVCRKSSLELRNKVKLDI